MKISTGRPKKSIGHFALSQHTWKGNGSVTLNRIGYGLEPYSCRSEMQLQVRCITTLQ